jgi:hypothetical protein
MSDRDGFAPGVPSLLVRAARRASRKITQRLTATYLVSRNSSMPS